MSSPTVGTFKKSETKTLNKKRGEKDSCCGPAFWTSSTDIWLQIWRPGTQRNVVPPPCLLRRHEKMSDARRAMRGAAARACATAKKISQCNIGAYLHGNGRVVLMLRHAAQGAKLGRESWCCNRYRICAECAVSYCIVRLTSPSEDPLDDSKSINVDGMQAVGYHNSDLDVRVAAKPKAGSVQQTASQSSVAVAGSEKSGNAYTLSFEEYKELFERITAMAKSGSLSRMHEHALYDAIASKDPRIQVAFRKVKELNDQSALLALARQRASESN